MSEQIVDLSEAVMPGPRGVGSIGPRGLPGVNAVPADEAVAGYIAAEGSRTWQALHPARHAVFVGDSITHGYAASTTADRWSSLVCSWNGLIEHNYAVSGSGFTVRPAGGGRFDDQAATACADASWPHGLCSHVFVAGGVNDGIPADMDEAAGTVRDVVDRLRRAFPRARIIGMFVLSGPRGGTYSGSVQNGELMPWIHRVQRIFLDAGCDVMAMPWRWLISNDSLTIDDNLHPNTEGHRLIAGIVNSQLHGVVPPQNLESDGGAGPLSFEPVDGRLVIDDGALRCRMGAETVCVYGDIKVTCTDDFIFEKFSPGAGYCNLAQTRWGSWFKTAPDSLAIPVAYATIVDGDGAVTELRPPIGSLVGTGGNFYHLRVYRPLKSLDGRVEVPGVTKGRTLRLRLASTCLPITGME